MKSLNLFQKGIGEIFNLKLIWEKPVIVFYKERLEEPETKAMVVIKAKRLEIIKEKGNSEMSGTINDFFPLMGDIDYISSEEGKSDRYVLCWFDDRKDDFSKSWRRLIKVTFSQGFTFSTNRKGKRTYNASFSAKSGKLN
jgi:hypothetical protein